MTNIISIYNLSKAFDGKKLFQNFNFTVKKNSVHALIGANGAGKTTLLRLLTGLYEPDEGKISVSGKHAMLLENDYLYEDKTGLENLKIFGLYFGYYVKDYRFTVLPVLLTIPVFLLLGWLIPCMMYDNAAKCSIVDQLRDAQ